MAELDALDASDRNGLALGHNFDVIGGSATDFEEVGTPPLFGNTDDNTYIRQGAATASGVQNNVAGLGIQWGLWTSSVLAPSVRQNATASEVQGLDKFIMISAVPTDGETIANMEGTLNFNVSSQFLANRSASGPTVQGVNGSFTVDLNASSTNLTNGTLNLCIGASVCNSVGQVWERWHLSFSGNMNLTNGRVEDMVLDGNIVTSDGNFYTSMLEGGNLFTIESSRSLRGTLSGFMTGNSGEGFVAGFKIFEEIANEEIPSNSIIGATAFRLPQAISTTEVANLADRRGFAIIAPGTSNSGISIGKTPDFAQGYDPMLYSSSPGFILRPANSSHTDYVGNVNGYDVQWGRWQGTAQDPLHYQFHLSNGALFNEIVGDVLMVSAIPSPEASLTGVHYFETVGDFLAGGTSTIDSLSGSFDIDLDSGFLTNGKLKLIVAGGLQTWTADTFSGPVSGALLPVTSLHGVITVDGSNDTDDFYGSITGVFTGSSDLGFTAGFDLQGYESSQRLQGAVLFEKIVLVPVYTALEYDDFEEDGRFGFFLSGKELGGEYDRLALYGTTLINVNGSAGATEDFIASDISDVVAIDDTPEKILQRKTAEITDLSTNVNLTGINWGRWSTPGEGPYFRLFDQYNDDRKYENLETFAIWANFEPTSTANLTAIGNAQRTYAGQDGTMVGLVSHMIANGNNTVHEIKSVFDIDFATGVLSNGLLSLCVGGGSNCSNDSEIWDITYTGNFHHGVLTGFDIVQTRIDDLDFPMSGTILGAFTGTTAQHYIGGVNMYVTSDAGRNVTAAFLMGQSTYLTGEEISGLNNDQYGMLATSGATLGLFGGRSLHQGNSSNYLLADVSLTGSSWHNATAFHEDVPVNIFRRGTSTQNVDNDVLNDDGSLVWGKWSGESGAPIRRASYNPEDEDGTLTQNAYWFIATPSAPAELAGKYAAFSNLIAVQGGGSGGALLKNHVTDFGFTVDLGTGTISNGNIRVENGVTWNVDFTGQARGKVSGFGPYLALTLGNAGTIEYNPNYSFAGSMAGMFINGGDQAVLSFAFKNEHESGAGEHVSGTLAVAKEDLTVDWGAWNNSTIANLSGAIETDANNLFDGLQLTPEFVIKQLQGKWRYGLSDGSGYGTGSSAGTFSDVDASFNIDFEDGSITEGHLEVISGTVAQKWHLHFDGALANGSVTLTPDTGSLSITDVSTSANVPLVGAGSANLGGAFTGADGSGFVGAFDLRDSAPIIQNSVQGVFTLQKDFEITGC